MTRKQHELSVAIPDVISRPVPRRTMLKGVGLASVLVGVPGLTSACAGNDSGKDGEDGGAKTLNFYNWTAYIDDTSEPAGERTIPLFESETGIKVNYRTYSSNDELLAKLRAGDTGFDLVVPSDVYVQRLIQADMLRPLDVSRIPNLANLAPGFKDLFYDPKGDYSVPWATGNTGIGYNKAAVTETVEDASIFGNPNYSGKMSLLDEIRSTVVLALLYRGLPPDTGNDKDLDEAFGQLDEWKANGVSVTSDYQDALGAGDLVVSHAYSGDVFQQIDAGNQNLVYVIPKQGADKYVDAMCIPQDAPNPENAETFMNYIYEPDVSARLMTAIAYRNGNEKAYALLPESIRQNTAMFPSPEEEARLTFAQISDETDEKWRTRWDKFVTS